jgi:hypothetical protein
MEKPFAFGILASGDYFINREKESERLVNNFRFGINTILISPRRWGKSSLVKKSSEKALTLESKLRFAFIDIFSVRTEEEFYNLYASQLLKAATFNWEERIELAGKIFKSIVPKVNMNIDPIHDFSINMDWSEVKKSPEEILNMAENLSKEKDIMMVVCLDEFQNINQFENPVAFQKKLRSFWQKHTMVSYCLYGSKRNMMMDIFESRSMPFYKFGDTMFLEKIAPPYWTKYIVERFHDTGKSITESQANAIALSMENHPYFVQQLAQEVWYCTDKVCEDKFVNEAIDELTIKNNILYQRELEWLTGTQIGFLKALLDEVEQYTSIEVLSKYKLGTSANIKRIKEALIQKEIIDFDGKKPIITDPLFKAWLQKMYKGN